MDTATYIKWLTARTLFEIWSPDKWDYYPFLKRKKQLQLFYRAKGIVAADRSLTDRDG